MMQGFFERINSWNQMMLSPHKTAALYSKKRGFSFREGLENFGMPIIETYAPLLLLTE